MDNRLESKSRLLDLAREGNMNINQPSVSEIDGSSMLDISNGMSSDVVLYTLSNEVVTDLTQRIKDEYNAHYFYRNAANWLRDANYKKAESFFKIEADTELEHAKWIQEYMADFNVVANIPQAITTCDILGLPYIINKAYNIELDLMKKYTEMSSRAFSMGDLTTFDFLQKFRKIQKKSVIEYNDLINALELVNKENKFELLYFEQTYF